MELFSVYTIDNKNEFTKIGHVFCLRDAVNIAIDFLTTSDDLAGIVDSVVIEENELTCSLFFSRDNPTNPVPNIIHIDELYTKSEQFNEFDQIIFNSVYKKSPDIKYEVEHGFCCVLKNNSILLHSTYSDINSQLIKCKIPIKELNFGFSNGEYYLEDNMKNILYSSKYHFDVVYFACVFFINYVFSANGRIKINNNYLYEIPFRFPSQSINKQVLIDINKMYRRVPVMVDRLNELVNYYKGKD